MNIAIFSARSFERKYLEQAGKHHHLRFLNEKLTPATASLAQGCDVASLFVTDQASAESLRELHRTGIRFIALRSAGYNHIDLVECARLGIRVARASNYSPHAIAEHAVGLILALNRKLILAHDNILHQDFRLDHLTGFDLNGKTVGIIGTGRIGSVMAKILHGFGCRLLAYDKVKKEELKMNYGVRYTDLHEIFRTSDIITLHIPLTSETEYMVDEESIGRMKRGVMLINTARGKIVNTRHLIDALKSGHISAAGLDVYENENRLFFEDRSQEIILDDTWARLLSFKNVLVTGHQAFFTDTALRNIAETTMRNISSFENGSTDENFL